MSNPGKIIPFNSRHFPFYFEGLCQIYFSSSNFFKCFIPISHTKFMFREVRPGYDHINASPLDAHTWSSRNSIPYFQSLTHSTWVSLNLLHNILFISHILTKKPGVIFAFSLFNSFTLAWMQLYIFNSFTPACGSGKAHSTGTQQEFTVSYTNFYIVM